MRKIAYNIKFKKEDKLYLSCEMLDNAMYPSFKQDDTLIVIKWKVLPHYALGNYFFRKLDGNSTIRRLIYKNEHYYFNSLKYKRINLGKDVDTEPIFTQLFVLYGLELIGYVSKHYKTTQAGLF